MKKRILEFLAVRLLKGNNKGSIICFHGPPGVGKTSLGKSIANALGRKFDRISLGGITDVSEFGDLRRLRLARSTILLYFWRNWVELARFGQ